MHKFFIIIFFTVFTEKEQFLLWKISPIISKEMNVEWRHCAWKSLSCFFCILQQSWTCTTKWWWWWCSSKIMSNFYVINSKLFLPCSQELSINFTSFFDKNVTEKKLKPRLANNYQLRENKKTFFFYIFNNLLFLIYFNNIFIINFLIVFIHHTLWSMLTSFFNYKDGKFFIISHHLFYVSFHFKM